LGEGTFVGVADGTGVVVLETLELVGGIVVLEVVGVGMV